MEIKNFKDLAEHLSIWPISHKDGVITVHNDLPFEEWEQRCSRRLYKNTVCGAWMEFEEGGIKIGSIVEGTEQAAEPISLQFPFTTDEFYAAVGDIEEQCKIIWNNTHGCEQCEADGFEDPETGEIMVNPDCPVCKGKGIII